MPSLSRYLVTATFIIEAENATHAENIVSNAVESTAYHYETDDVNAVSDDGEDNLD